MRINFFEEFPTQRNLKKLSWVDWPCTIYVAAKSVTEFVQLCSISKNRKVVFGYWPVLKKKEGYWLSPFSSFQAVKRITEDIEKHNKPLKIMWDAELPFRHPMLFLRLDNFFRNKILFKKFFKRNGKKIITSEYPLKNRFAEIVLKGLGVSFSPKKYGNKKIVMYYTSMHEHLRPVLLRMITNSYQKYGDKLTVGLGTIATGILGDEPILSAKNLKRDLSDMKKIGVKEVTIFRLGGMNKEYKKVIKGFV